MPFSPGKTLWLCLIGLCVIHAGVARAAESRDGALGAATTDGVIELEVGKHILVKKVPVRSARTAHGAQTAPIDGNADSRDFQGKPAEYPANRDHQDCGGLHLTFVDDLGIDAVLLRGTAAGVVYKDTASQKTGTDEKKLFDFSMGQNRVFRQVFNKRVYPETLDVFHSGACGSAESGVLADLSFYRIDRGAAMPQIGFYGLQGFAKPSPLIAEALAGQFGPKQVVEGLVYAAKSSSFLSVSGRGFAHILIDDLPTDKAIDKVTFLLGVKTVEAPALLTLRIHDPLDPVREIMGADFMVKGEGLHLITLDTPDIVLLPGALPPALWISVGSNKSIAIKAPRVGLSWLPVEAAREETLLWRAQVLQSYALPGPSTAAPAPNMTEAARRAADVAHLLENALKEPSLP